MKLVLASASPRRAEILRNAGFEFDTRAMLVDESLRAGEQPGAYVCRLAVEKARAAAAAQVHASDSDGASDGASDRLFIGADTAVVVDGEIFGKPESGEDARRMLRRLSGRAHEVHTGLALLREPGGVESVGEEITRVVFAPLSDEEIDRYVETGEPFGKAGAYAIQGAGGRYVERIEGCYFNVVGFPLARFWACLREFGWRSELHGAEQNRPSIGAEKTRRNAGL
jgi:septum formation protein